MSKPHSSPRSSLLTRQAGRAELNRLRKNASKLSFRAVMGQRPTHRNESQHVTPAEAGVHIREELDSRFRGNDATFHGAKRRITAVLESTNCVDPSSSASKRGGLLRMSATRSSSAPCSTSRWDVVVLRRFCVSRRGERPFDRLILRRCSPSLSGAGGRALPSALLRDAERSRPAPAPGPNAVRPYVCGCGSTQARNAPARRLVKFRLAKAFKDAVVPPKKKQP